MVIAATKRSCLLASDASSSFGGAAIPSRLKCRQIVVAGLGRRQAGTHVCAIIAANTIRVTGGTASPFAGLNARHGGQSVNNVEWVDHRDESRC